MADYGQAKPTSPTFSDRLRETYTRLNATEYFLEDFLSRIEGSPLHPREGGAKTTAIGVEPLSMTVQSLEEVSHRLDNLANRIRNTVG